MIDSRISIQNLIEIVKAGGCVKTGVDIYNTGGRLLLGNDMLVDKVRILEIIRENGVQSIPVNLAMEGGLWDGNGNRIRVGPDGLVEFDTPAPVLKEVLEKEDHFIPPFLDPSNPIEKKLRQIQELKKVAIQKYHYAKQSIQKVLTQIKDTGGEFDYQEVEDSVSDLVAFLEAEDNPFTYLTQEIFSYDDYLYNHSINVCTIGTAIMRQFNDHFSRRIDSFLTGSNTDLNNPFDKITLQEAGSYSCYYKDDLADISLGFFLHDMGKILVADQILNKPGKLTDHEFNEVKKHSYEYGMKILEKNKLKNSYIKNIVRYHHAPLYPDEARCYPENRTYKEIPIYARICKLADMYDAMTSRRCYKEAFNQINVVTELFRKYAKKDAVLQYILHSFVKSIGIYPPGSIIYLRNGQMAYVLDSKGPIVLPFTDTREQTLSRKPDPIDIGLSDTAPVHKADNRRSIKNPREVYALLPAYMKSIINPTVN